MEIRAAVPFISLLTNGNFLNSKPYFTAESERSVDLNILKRKTALFTIKNYVSNRTIFSARLLRKWLARDTLFNWPAPP